MDKNLILLFALLVGGYLYFYLSSKQYLRREYFEPMPLADAFNAPSPSVAVSWPGGVVSPPAFDNTKNRERFGMTASGTYF
jgi:hypothetical protein